MQSDIGIEDFAGVAEEERVRAGGEVSESVVDEVGGGGAEDVANRAEVVGQGPEDVGRSRVGEEFILCVGRPEVMVGNRAVIDLDRRLVIFGDEDGFVVADYLADPDVVVIVGVFDCLNCHPFLFSRIPFLLRDGGQAVAMVPRVQFAVCGVGFGYAVSFGVVSVCPRAVAG